MLRQRYSEGFVFAQGPLWLISTPRNLNPGFTPEGRTAKLSRHAQLNLG